MHKQASLNIVEKNELYLKGLPSAFDGTNLFFISDIHHRVISDEILEEIRNNTDLIVIGGDLLEKKVPIERAEVNIKKLRAVAPTIFVWGNNDYETDFRRLEAVLTENGVTILANEAQMLERNGKSLFIIGVDDVGRERDNLSYAIKDCNENDFRIVISHYPKIAEKIKDEHNIGLVLSGHTHGGQIRILGFGIEEVGGLKKERNFYHLISNGYGTTRLPLRLGAPPQTHLLTLKSFNK